MFRSFVVPIIFSLLLLSLVACATEGDPETATQAPILTATDAPLPGVAAPTMPPATPAPNIQPFEEQLMQALERRDDAQLQSLMGDSFMIAGWRSEGTAYAPEAAIQQLRNNYLGQAAQLVFDPTQDLVALLDGTDPLSILSPDVIEPRAMFVAGWGIEGQDEAILYIAQRADGSPYWYGVLFSSGGFAPATSGQELHSTALLAVPEAGIAIGLPPGHMLMKNTELYRRGSFASYDFVLPQSYDAPYLAEIQLFSRESIEGFASRCDGTEAPCFYGDYPDVARYEGQKAAFEQRQDFDGVGLQAFGGRDYFVSQHRCEGAPCVVREYTTFAGNTKVDVWVMTASAAAEAQAAQADALVEQLKIQDDWAGIGAMPGPLYTLLEPGVTLRQPLGWTVREEAGSETDFVVHSVSFIPPAFAQSDQPQVPAINLFVYGAPLGDSLQAWLDTYSTTDPFGSQAGPATHFFGVHDTREIQTASFSGLQFTHDVLGLDTYQLLFRVGQTVVGLSTVDFGPEDLRPTFLQMQSSLAAANTNVPVVKTDVKYVVAMADAPMYRGPAGTFQQIGQVMDGQLALVTGASEDGEWWRVICPNDTIGECWISADPQATQPTTPPADAGAAPTGVSCWIAYRDERYGYGLALPCHWLRFPPPLEGNFATLTVRSYDDAFRSQNSVKGEWKDGRWPDGAMKLDVTVVEGLPADQSLSEFLSELLLGNELTTVEAVEETTIGSYPAISAVTDRSDNLSDRHTTLAVRLAPDKALLMSVLPETAWASGDIQGIVNSIALSATEEVVVPSWPPAPPFIDVPQECSS